MSDIKLCEECGNGLFLLRKNNEEETYTAICSEKESHRSYKIRLTDSCGSSSPSISADLLSRWKKNNPSSNRGSEAFANFSYNRL